MPERGLLSVWNRNLLGYPTVAVLPYAQELARFPAYLLRCADGSLYAGITTDLGARVVQTVLGLVVTTAGIAWLDQARMAAPWLTTSAPATPSSAMPIAVGVRRLIEATKRVGSLDSGVCSTTSSA